MRKTLFLICIIFSLIDLSAVLPINIKHEIGNSAKETKIVKRDCNFRKFVGSNLFDGSRKNCFSPEDINLLVARREFEIMIPKELPPDLLDDKSVSQILRFFYHGFWLFRRLSDCNKRRIMEKAFYDTLGGFLRYYLVPVCKFSFYASKVELKTVRNVMILYQKCRAFLNTNGNGWVEPMSNPLTELKCVKIEPIKITEQENFDDDKCCIDLDLSTAPNSGMEVVDEYMLIALPKLEVEDSDGFLSNIWLPFSRKRTYNLRSCKSAFILLKYYRSVSRCYKKKSLPQKCFDRKFRQWIVENVKMHLSDEQFYPGLGGVLNIYENTLLGEPAATNELKYKNEFLNENDDFNLDVEFEGYKKRDLSNSIYDEDLLENNATKDYGDKNLNDWLIRYNNIDVNDNEIIPAGERKHMKCRPKCKKKKQPHYPLKPPEELPMNPMPVQITISPTIEKTTKPTKPTKTPKEPPSTTTKKYSDFCEEPHNCANKYVLFGFIEFFLLLLIMAVIYLLWSMFHSKEGWKAYLQKFFKKDDKAKENPSQVSVGSKEDAKKSENNGKDQKGKTEEKKNGKNGKADKNGKNGKTNGKSDKNGDNGKGEKENKDREKAGEKNGKNGNKKNEKPDKAAKGDAKNEPAANRADKRGRRK